MPLAGRRRRRPFHVEVERRLLQLLRLQRVQRLVGVLLHRQERRHCLAGVVEDLLIATTERVRRSGEVHHHLVAHLPCRHLQPLQLRFQGLVQSCNRVVFVLFIHLFCRQQNLSIAAIWQNERENVY